MIALSPTSTMFVRFGKLALAGLVPLALVAGVGAVLTHRVAGRPGLIGMLAGCGVGLIGNWIGVLPAAMAGDLRGQSGTLAILLGTCLRFLAALILAPVLALSGLVAVKPFVLWVALSYLTILFGETIMLLNLTRTSGGQEQ